VIESVDLSVFKRSVASAAVVLVAWAFFTPSALGAAAPPAEVTKAAEPGSPLETILFYAIAAMTIVCALGVCASRNIGRMAVWLFGGLGSVAILYFMLAANFIAAIQLIVYVGGTLILLVFGVMLTSRSPWMRFAPARWEVIGAAAVSLGLLICLIAVFLGAHWGELAGAGPGSSVMDIGRSLMGKYVVPFEVAAVLLMIVMVGAAHLARQEKK